MTEKKQRILNTALELFAHNGYANTSTKKVAKAAQVSEALIFRHFGSKLGLLDSIITLGLEKASQEYWQVFETEDPKKRIESAIDFVVYMLREQANFWRLRFSLRFQSPEIEQKYIENAIWSAAMNALEQAFEELGYEDPARETALLTMIIKGIFLRLVEIQDEEGMQDEVIRFVKNKYDITSSRIV